MLSKFRQALSIRLSAMKRKFRLGRISVPLHVWGTNVRENVKEAFLVCKYGLTIQWLKLRMALSPGNLRTLPARFWAWLCALPATFRGLRKSGVLASLVVLSLILLMGHSATVAWLTYTTPTTRNTFQVGQMNLYVGYRHDGMTDFQPMTIDSSVFNDEAIYEPGYTQVVYFQVKNNGNIPFDYRISARDYQSIEAENVYGRKFDLADYLYFGMVTAPTQAELEAMLESRQEAQDWAKDLASQKLGTYTRDGSRLAPGQEEYAAIVLYMPWFVDNEANHSGTAPQVIMGVTVNAQQVKN